MRGKIYRERLIDRLVDREIEEPRDGWTCKLHRQTDSALHCTALHCTALYNQTETGRHCTGLHCTGLHCTGLHCTVLHCTALHCTALHCTALHCIALHCIVLYWGEGSWHSFVWKCSPYGLNKVTPFICLTVKALHPFSTLIHVVVTTKRDLIYRLNLLFSWVTSKNT